MIRNFSPDSPNPRERRAYGHAVRDGLIAELGHVTSIAGMEYRQQIEEARKSLGDTAENLNYEPSASVLDALDGIDAAQTQNAMIAVEGPSKAAKSGINAPIHTDRVRHGSIKY